MTLSPLARRRWLAALALCVASATGAAPRGLSPEVEAALAKAQLPLDAVSVVVVPADARSAVRISHRPDVAVNPASVMKLVTTAAALDLLGPSFTWTTPIYVDGPITNGLLQGNLYVKGMGDPQLTVERLWQLLYRVQSSLGVRHISGDIVLDHSAFDLPPGRPGDFDGEPLRPYNATPDALLVNHKALTLFFAPRAAEGVASVSADLPMAGLSLPSQVPLLPGACTDLTPTLKPDFSNPLQLRLDGGYPAQCADRAWSVALADPESFARRAFEGVWRQLGGQLQGQVRDGVVPTAVQALPPALEVSSPTLAEAVRGINKYSNNLMTQQLLLTLALQFGDTLPEPAGATAPRPLSSAPATFERGRSLIARWWQRRLPDQAAPVLENGSGLSRIERVTARGLATLLAQAERERWFADYLASMPLAGTDGTLRRLNLPPTLSAHLKTGTLRDASALAGYVHTADGRRYVVVAVANHPAQTVGARSAFAVLLESLARKPGSKP